MKPLAFFALGMILFPIIVVSGDLYASSASAPAEMLVVSPAAEKKAERPDLFTPGDFEDPKVCSTCHRDIYNEWSKSMHAYAWEDKWYQPDYLLAHQQTDGATDLLCGACHAPIAARTGLLPPADGSRFDEASRRGISCDFCHTVTGVEKMFNMGQLSEPGEINEAPVVMAGLSITRWNLLRSIPRQTSVVPATWLYIQQLERTSLTPGKTGRTTNMANRASVVRIVT